MWPIALRNRPSLKCATYFAAIRLPSSRLSGVLTRTYSPFSVRCHRTILPLTEALDLTIPTGRKPEKTARVRR
jgi:hypothetical protein